MSSLARLKTVGLLRRVALFGMAALAFGVLFGARATLASANIGPDPDFDTYSTQYGMSYNASIPREYRYLVSTNHFAVISTSKIKIYLPTSSGTITITDPDYCSNRKTVYGSPTYYVGDDADSSDFGVGDVTKFTITSNAGGSWTGKGKWDSSSNCYTHTLPLNVSGSTLDPNTGMYPYLLTASAVPNGEFGNTYGVTAPPGAIVSADATQTAQSFGMRAYSPVAPPNPEPRDPWRNYHTWDIPFAPDCSVTGSSVERPVEFFDDDNFGGDGAQLSPFWVQLREYDRSGNFLGVVRPNSVSWTRNGTWGSKRTLPTSDSAGGWAAKTYNGEPYEYIYTNQSLESFRAYYNYQANRIYRFRILSVFYNNTVQLKMPFESTYYYRPCQISSLNAQINVFGNDPTGPEISAGNTYTLHATAINNGSTASLTPGYLEVTATTDSATGPPFALASGSTATGDPPNTNESGYQPNTQLQATGQSGFNRFYWVYPGGFPANSTRWPPDGLTFKVPAGTPSGTVLCFTAYASHDTNGGYGGGPAGSTSVKCYTVKSPRYPGIKAQSSDVHAGGGIGACKASPATGNIITLPSSNSMGEYVVASSGSIGDFMSNGALVANNDTLKLGGSGGYAQVCRPDLYKTANNYRMSAGISPLVTSNFSVTGKGGVYFIDSPTGTVTVSGTISQKITLVTGGNVIINGATTLDGTTARAAKDAASLGIIAHGNIGVDDSVTRVDAYLFADGTIDTCDSPANTASCGNTLRVNGFLMARSIDFRRTGPNGTTGAQLAEQIVMNPQIYLNPPQFFDTATSSTSPSGQGERRPLF